jgi:murein DD-endopeptidase MepM/ murein hydrolase activator NlpD
MKAVVFWKKLNNKGIGRAGLIILLPFVILVLAYVVYQIFLIPAPLINGIESFKLLPADKTVHLNAANIKSLAIDIYQGNRQVELLNDKPLGSEKRYSIQVRPKDLKLSDGTAVIVIRARAGFFKKIKHEISATIDTVRPTLTVLKSPSIIYQGSAGLALLRAKGASSVSIKLGNHVFPAFKAINEEASQHDPEDVSQGSGSSGKQYPETYYAFFPAPPYIKEKNVYYVTAEDAAGNTRVKSLTTKIKTKAYRVSSIEIDDSFIQSVVLPLLNRTDIEDPEEAFRTVNEKWRKKSIERLFEITRTTEPQVLWNGRFLQLKNSKVMATYGDKRKYLFKGKELSESIHLGYDLASYERAPVEAANSGIVRYADDLSIYGNTVIIDHGFGLMSLYGHLSELKVNQGDPVKKGEIIARSGSTGLAGGDHLHFGILVHGMEVSPLYWWDPKWIEINITDYLTY